MDALEAYFAELSANRLAGAVPETSGYGPLANLLNEVGRQLKPKVRCVIHPANRGAGIPDGGFFIAGQFEKGRAEPLPGQLPARGALEVKPVEADVRAVAESEQVRRYLEKYRQVLVTTYREFVLVGYDADGELRLLESYSLAPTEIGFWSLASMPRKAAAQHGERLGEFLKRCLLRQAQIAQPQDLAWFLASYAREARARAEERDLPALAFTRKALEESLGMSFTGEKGDHFFRSTLVQTLFYGLFAAWVFWAEHHPPTDSRARFDWRSASRYLHIPILQKLFYDFANPAQLGALHLDEVLDWAAEALNRVDRATFFSTFEQSHAVQYFYEPFLEAFDPELRKELGVWYTPPEIVQYMVARVDAVLRSELEIADGLADPRVVVLDPCCGTGAYLVEVLNKIAATLREKGDDALLAHELKQAAMSRIYGFEILPAPFVISHLQIGMLLHRLGAPFADESAERAGVFLTNALTGWEPPTEPKQHLLFPEMEEERDKAQAVKQHAPILVILGNPPYNGFAGAAVAEERDLVAAYRSVKEVAPPQGQGLNDLYVRFFRMAERRITEGSEGEGIVCFISNYSWLDGLSFTGMRERYLEVFDRIWIDCMNGDKYKTGKLTPDGLPDPSVFSTEKNREGIQVGTAIAMLVRRADHEPPADVCFAQHWGRGKLGGLHVLTAEHSARDWVTVRPSLPLGLPLSPSTTSEEFASWPRLPELIDEYLPAVKTSRDLDLVAIDAGSLCARIEAYFDPAISDYEAHLVVPGLLSDGPGFPAAKTRRELTALGIASGEFAVAAYRPFDHRTLYWNRHASLLDRPRPELVDAWRTAGAFLICRPKGERSREGSPLLLTRGLPEHHYSRPAAACFPLWTQGPSSLLDSGPLRANRSRQAEAYVAELGCDGDPPRNLDVVSSHVLAVGHSARYLADNTDGIRQDWPRIPLPATREALLASAQLGRKVAALLDVEQPVDGVSTSSLRHELRPIGLIATTDGRQINPAVGDLAVNAGWGHAGKGGVTMPGKGRLVERPYTAAELAAFREGLADLGLNYDQLTSCLGGDCYDVYLNDSVYWRCVPSRVWTYTIGGYQVMKKWLSYRERSLLGRDLKVDEARYVGEMARRIAAILLLEPALDENYEHVKANTYPWPGASS